LRGLLPDDQVRSFKVRVLADTGAVMLVLPQDEVEALGLPEVRGAVVKHADERTEERSVAGPVTVRVDGRAATVDCIVGPPNSEPLLDMWCLKSWICLSIRCSTNLRLVRNRPCPQNSN